MSSTEDALAQLGVRPDTLDPDERAFLDRQGYLPLEDVLTEAHLNRMRDRLAELLDAEGASAGRELLESEMIKHPTEKGTDRLSDLVNKGDVFDICYTHPRVLAAIAYVLGPDFKLSSLNSRASRPGHGLQALHADYPHPVEPGDYRVCNSIWLLDDFTEENGATRLVPGTHRVAAAPEQEMEDPRAPHPDEMLLTAPAGTVVIFNSHVWHGGTVNRSRAPRRAVHAYFCRRDEMQQIDQKRYITNETLRRTPDAAWLILDVTQPSPGEGRRP